jgi:hypothetical protein
LAAAPAEELTELEECRLEAYIKAIRNVRVGPRQNRGSINDFIRLAARSTRHKNARGLLIQAIQEDDVIQAALGSTEEIYRARLSAEVERLAGVDIFGQYTPDAMDKIQELQDDALAEEIEEYAPSLFGLLENLCRSSRTMDKMVQRNRRRIVSILSIICFTRHPMKCNFLPAVIGLLLHSSGAKRQIYRITNSFGWTESYDSVLRSVDGLMNKARAFIGSRIKESAWAIVYDNCDLSIGVSEQSDTKKNELISITTGLLIPGRCHPARGIKQSDFDPEVKLRVGGIFSFSHNTEVVEQSETLKVQLTTALIYEAIHEAFPDVFTWYTRDRRDKNSHYYSLTRWPEIQLIDPQEHSRDLSRPIALMPIQMDESTISNNIDIIRNILREQLSLDDDFFETEPAIPAGGDNKTLNRMWSAKAGAADNTGAYDRLDHIVPLPGLFHAQMHVIEAIIKAHWGDEAKEGLKVDHCALRYSAGRMARRFVGPKNLVFTHGRTFVKDSLQARYIAELVENLGVDRKATIEQIHEEMKKLAKHQLRDLVVRTVKSIQYSDDTQCKDKERAENLRFVRDAEMFFILSHGIKHGDIGLIRYTLAPLIPLFYGVKKVAYAREFLYLKRLIDSRYASKEIADAIAATLLVNPSRKRDGFYAIDLANEFLNKDVKEVWANRRTSTASVRQLSEFCTLNSIFLRPLARKLNALWGHNSAGKHTRANRKSVILPLARELRVSMREDLNRTPYNLKWAEDKLMSGMKILYKRIGDFNNKFIQGNVDGEEDQDTIFLNTASAPDLDVQSGVVPNASLANAADALPVDEEFEEYLAEVDDYGPE